MGVIVESLQWKEAALDKLHAYPGASIYAALFTGVLDSFACTFSNGSLDISAAGHNYVVGMRVKFGSTGALPPDINTSNEYWIIAAASGTFQVSATRGGVAISFTGLGSGTHTVYEQSPLKLINGENAIVHDLSCLARHEAEYNGSGRQAMTFSAASRNLTTGKASCPTASAQFTPTTASISYQYFGVILEGLAIAGDSSGYLIGLDDYSSAQTITIAGKQFNYTPRL